jgi:hypothetical protein
MAGTPLHRRIIEFEALEEPGGIVVTGRLRDERPWAAGTELVEHLHDMRLEVHVRGDDLVITEARAVMDRYPHAECPAITEHFGELVGLNVGRGFTRAVQERFAGPLGCTHLEQLARTMGPVVIQAMTSLRAKNRDWARLDTAPSTSPSLFPRNTCHIWAEEGVAEQKLAAGWRPGMYGYPAPPVAVVVRLREEETAAEAEG